MTLWVRSNCGKILAGELEQGLDGWTTLNLYGNYVVIKWKTLGRNFSVSTRTFDF